MSVRSDTRHTTLSLLLILFILAAQTSLLATLPKEGQDLLLAGKYEEAIEVADRKLRDAEDKSGWYRVKTRGLLETGRLEQAIREAPTALSSQANLASVRLLLYELATKTQPRFIAQRLLHPVVRLNRDKDLPADELAATGIAYLELGADPRTVLEDYLEPARKQDPKARLPHLAIGELALEKQDFELAAETYREALKQHPDDPDFLFGLGLALYPSSPQTAGEYVERALERNPRHAEALLWLARQKIDAREFDPAVDLLEKITATNPLNAKAWGLRTAIAELRNDPEAAQQHRQRALALWNENPVPDEVTGTALARNYLFDEGIDYLHKSLERDDSYLPARLQLGIALLRQGRDDEGWPHIDYARARDPYNIIAYNLVELRDRLQEFTVLEKDGIRLRMDEKEADIYGRHALDLLTRSRKKLTEKYGIDLPYDVTVEIFARQSDFAIRTFSLPGGEGFLGVCFGPLITAASPGGRLGRANWEAVLWHEFAHTVTLALTRNRIPRWLTEGISVYEERQEDPSWGFRMGPAMRKKILDSELPDVRDFNALFRQPDMQFAYLYSSLIVEYIVDQYGFDKLTNILAQLRQGRPIDDALENSLGNLDQFTEAANQFVRTAAQEYGGDWKWDYPEGEQLSTFASDPWKWHEAEPENFWGIIEAARASARDGEWNKVQDLLEPVVESGLIVGEPGNPHELLAEAYRQLDDPDAERETLEQFTNRNSDSLSARLRLLEIADAADKHEAIIPIARQVLAIDPLSLRAHQALAESSREMGDRDQARQSYWALLRLNPPDKSSVHYQLATLMEEEDPKAALQQVLMALELSPRFRDAYPLLQRLNQNSATQVPDDA